jgi:hypothetical protein
MRRATPTSAVLLACLLGAPGVVSGQARSSQGSGALQRIILDAANAGRSGDWAGALAGFRRAESMARDPEVLADLRYNIGRCHQELGEPEAAIEAFRAVDTGDKVEKARARIVEVERAFFGGLSVRCRPAGARVALRRDGADAVLPERACDAAWRRIRAGRYVVAVETDEVAGDYHVEVLAERDNTLEVTLPAEVRVERNDGPATVRLGSVPLGPTPTRWKSVAAGEHVLEARAEDGTVERNRIVLGAGRRRVVRLGDGAPVLAGEGLVTAGPSDAGPDRTWAWVATGGAALTLGVGAWFWSDAAGAFDDAEAAQRRYDRSGEPDVLDAARAGAEDANARGENSRTAAYVLVGTGVALAGVATWLWLDGPGVDGAGPTGGQASISATPTGLAVRW